MPHLSALIHLSRTPREPSNPALLSDSRREYTLQLQLQQQLQQRYN
jgi:hypothetical protein